MSSTPPVQRQRGRRPPRTISPRHHGAFGRDRYAAPLILLAQTRQADRDRARDDLAAAHPEALQTALAEAVAEIRTMLEERPREQRDSSSRE